MFWAKSGVNCRLPGVANIRDPEFLTKSTLDYFCRTAKTIVQEGI